MDEKIMRTSVFGGFKKVDVLSYVEELQKQIEQLKSDAELKEKEISQLNEKVSELTSMCGELECENDELTDENDELKASVEEKNTQLEAVKEQNREMSESIAELTEIKEEYAGVKKKYENNTDELKKAQSRLGAAYLDARKYSEKIVASANERAHNASKAAGEDITRQANEISRLSQDIEKLSASFTNSINELQANIAVLSQRMAAAAKNLSVRHDASFEPDLTLNFELDDDARGVIETNDGSGLTYIQYPPNTDFNEDLNIRPDSTFDFGKNGEQA